jgi:hypothetical protein
MFTIVALAAYPHPIACRAFELWLVFSDGAQERLDMGAYMPQAARSIAASYDVPLRITED